MNDSTISQKRRRRSAHTFCIDSYHVRNIAVIHDHFGDRLITLARDAGDAPQAIYSVRYNAGRQTYDARTIIHDDGVIFLTSLPIGGKTTPAPNERIASLIRDLNRESCERLLTAASIQYEHESDAELRQAVVANYRDGTISRDDILSAWDECAATGAKRFRSHMKTRLDEGS